MSQLVANLKIPLRFLSRKARFPQGEFFRAMRSEIWNPGLWLVCEKIRCEKVGGLKPVLH